MSGAARTAAPALELRGAARRWAGGSGLGPVDLVVGRGETVGLIGESGSGRSTLLRLVSLPLVLEGAVPAALLALAVDGACGLLARAVVPAGLRAAAAPPAP